MKNVIKLFLLVGILFYGCVNKKNKDFNYECKLIKESNIMLRGDELYAELFHNSPGDSIIGYILNSSDDNIVYHKGKYFFQKSLGTMGLNRINGVVEFLNGNKAIINDSLYVIAPNANISNMNNTLVYNKENQLHITVEGFPNDLLKVKVKNGNIIKDDYGYYMFTPTSKEDVIIDVLAYSNGAYIPMGQFRYKVVN